MTTHRSRHIVAMPLNDFLTDASLEMLPVELGVLKMRNAESWERGMLDAFKSWKNCGVIIDHVISDHHREEARPSFFPRNMMLHRQLQSSFSFCLPPKFSFLWLSYMQSDDDGIG